jgi:hypothetical protein
MITGLTEAELGITEKAQQTKAYAHQSFFHFQKAQIAMDPQDAEPHYELYREQLFRLAGHIETIELILERRQ